MPVTPKTLRLAQRVRNDLLRVTDAHTRELTKAWVDAWDDISGDLEKAMVEMISTAQGGIISQATVLRSQRMLLVLDLIARRLTKLTEAAGNLVTGDLLQVVRDASNAQTEVIAQQLPKADRESLVSQVRIDARQIDAIVQRSTERITSQMWPLSAEADAAVRREIVRGLATGTGPRQTAAAIIDRTEGAFNGGLTRALTIARTETLDAHRAGAKAAHEENADVLRGWMWLAALSPRTCPACIALNGTEHPLSDDGPNGHQNCRCARMPVTKSWADLGIDLDEPDPAATGSQAWFDALDEKTQRQILGPAKLAAYQRGDFPMSKWAVKRSNDGWRDSYVPAPAPKPR
jgi:SPP1 gp7 family putative phage head morphogenesis protein